MRKKAAVLFIVAGTVAGSYLALFHSSRKDQRDFESDTASLQKTETAGAPAHGPLHGTGSASELHRADNSQNPTGTTSKTAEAQQHPTHNFNAYAHFQMGNYEGAVNQLRVLIKMRPNDEIIRKNLATSLLALGFFRLQKKEIAEAESAFDESAKLGNIDASKAQAALKIKQGQLEIARELLEDLSKGGADPDSYRILIDLALSQDEIERADDLLNRLSESLARTDPSGTQPTSQDILKFIELSKKRLEQKKNFLRVQDIISRQGIEVSFSSPELKQHAESVARAIESVQSKLVNLLGPLPANSKLRAWLVPTGDFKAITGAPPWAAAVFDGYMRIQVGRSSNGKPFAPEILERLAQHETTHAYIYAFCGDVLPSWISEGLAQIYEGRNISHSQSDILRTGRKALQKFDPELGQPFIQAPASSINRLYARSHLLVTAMSRDGGGVTQTWQSFLSAVCIQRRPLPDVLQDQFSVESLEELWGKYFGNSAETP
jgi:tetratricopeptide (TPR) repeat protein